MGKSIVYNGNNRPKWSQNELNGFVLFWGLFGVAIGYIICYTVMSW